MTKDRELIIKQAIDLAVQYQQAGDLLKAEGIYQTILQTEPNHPVAIHMLGLKAHQEGSHDIAVDLIRKSLAIEPNSAIWHKNLGVVLREQSKFNEAIESYQKALTIKPNYAEVYYNLGNALVGLNKMGEAAESFQKAFAIEPNYAAAHTQFGILLLQTGQFKKGWEEYEWRLQKKDARVANQTLEMWQGSPLHGKNIHVYADQGVGDEILFSSCIPDLIQKSPNKIYLECDPRLAPLFARSFPEIIVCGKARDTDISWIGSDIYIDYTTPIDSLGRFFRNHLKDFLKRDAFLVPDLKLVEKWEKRLAPLGASLKVGISWRGGAGSRRNPNSITLDVWKNILSLEATFVNLQYGEVKNEILHMHNDNGIKIHDWEDNDPLFDLDNQAALISSLDLVISVDNSTVHSCGALGTPVWDMVDPAVNQMWMDNGTNSTPLYAHVRLFKKQVGGEWGDVLKQVEVELFQLIEKSSKIT